MIETEKISSCKDCMDTFTRGIFSEEDFYELESNKVEMTFVKDDVIIKQGTFVSQVMFLKKGIVKVVLEGKNEKNTILNINEGKIFVALSVLANPNIYPFSVIALSNCTVCLIRKEAILNIMENNVRANRFLMNSFHEENIYLYNRISVLSTRNNHGKLASALLFLYEMNSRAEVFKKVSRKELSQFASISIESTNKILNELKNDRLIDIENNTIKVLRADLIKKLSTVG